MPAARQLDALAQEQAEEARALEEETAAEADGGTSTSLAGLLATALAAWVAAFGSPTVVGTGAVLAAYLTKLRGSVGRAEHGLGQRAAYAVQGVLGDAAGMGARHVTEFARLASGDRMDVPDVEVARDAVKAAEGLADAVAEQLRLTARLLSPSMVRGWRDVMVGLGAARRAVTMMRATVAWAVHRALNGGATQAIAQLGAQPMWMAEPDACVRCLAYAGRFADRDGMFPGGLSMDPHTRTHLKAAIEGPPLHVGCRCRLVPWRPEWGAGPGSLPDLLRDRAWRSVATGGGRPTESAAARRRAAQALLAQRGIPVGVRRQAQATAAGRT